MSVILTQTQTVVNRLSPKLEEPPRKTPLITWPFLPKAQESTTMSDATVPKQRPPPMLRSSSFVKIRQFCNQSCDALLFLKLSQLSSIQATISHGLIQAKACMLVMAVYLTLAVLALQFAMCFYMLAGKSAPPGLVFMVVSLFAIVGMFSKIIINFTGRKPRQTRRMIHDKITKKVK